MGLFIGISPRFLWRRPLGGPGPKGSVFFVTKIHAYNIAAIALGVQPVQDPNEGSNTSRIFNARWDTARRSFLADHPYNQITTTVVLNELSGDPIAKYSNRFQLPGDVVRELYINKTPEMREAGPVFVLEFDPVLNTTVLLTDEASATLTYISDRIDVSHMRPKAVEALGLYLAYQVADAFGKNDRFKERLERKMKEAVVDARAVDSQAGSPPRRPSGKITRGMRRRR